MVWFFASIPFLLLYYLVPSNRGSPKRKISQEISFSMFRAIFKCVNDIRWQMPRPTVPDKTWESQFALIKPAKSEFYEGVAFDKFIKPEPVPAAWFPHAPRASEKKSSQRVFIHFHGGAYATGSYDSKAMGVVRNIVAEKCSALVLSAGYRKSSTPGCHFPSQLQDAITTYAYLLEEGFLPGNIIFSGNSSGGHLVFNLLRYILEQPSIGIPKPAAIVVSSPWVDLITSDYTDWLTRPSYAKDYGFMPFIAWCRSTYLPPGVDVASHPYLSIKDHPFGLGGVPAWVAFGEDELPMVEILSFVENFRKISGNVLEMYLCPNGPHDVMWTGSLLNFLDESRMCCDELSKFVDRYRL